MGAVKAYNALIDEEIRRIANDAPRAKQDTIYIASAEARSSEVKEAYQQHKKQLQMMSILYLDKS